MSTVYIPQKRKIELVSRHDRVPIAQFDHLDESRHVDPDLPGRKDEIEEGEILEDGRAFPRRSVSRTGYRDIPRAAINR